MRTLIAMVLIVGGCYLSYHLFKNADMVHGEWIIAGLIPVSGIALLFVTSAKEEFQRDIRDD